VSLPPGRVAEIEIAHLLLEHVGGLHVLGANADADQAAAQPGKKRRAEDSALEPGKLAALRGDASAA